MGRGDLNPSSTHKEEQTMALNYKALGYNLIKVFIIFWSYVT